MKATSLIMLIYLIAIGIFACLFALTGFDLLWAICFYNRIVYRIALALSGVAALWLIFWAIFFRPFEPLS